MARAIGRRSGNIPRLLEAVRSTANGYLDQAKRGIDPGQAPAHAARAGGLLIEQLAKDFDGPAAERRKAGGGGMTKLLCLAFGRSDCVSASPQHRKT
jgi:hypothetical protein